MLPADRSAFDAFLHGELPCLRCEPDGQLHYRPPTGSILFPGSFNPLHTGHIQLAEAASRLCGQAAVFELSLRNVDKPPLSPAEVRRRVAQFQWEAAVWLTHAPTFLEKARLFPGSTFVIGVDTAVRLVAPRYYGDSEGQMRAALTQLRDLAARFLVAGRSDAGGRFLNLADVALPAAYRDLFTDLPAFRIDCSSTALRQRPRDL